MTQCKGVLDSTNFECLGGGGGGGALVKWSHYKICFVCNLLSVNLRSIIVRFILNLIEQFFYYHMFN
jgi:hypothetical protein